MDSDIAVIGGGVVGLACAERLSRAGLSVVVVERWERFGTETSSRNSEVIHAGIYYPTGSLKARLCREGAALLYDWCERHHVRHARVGKYIVATSADEEPSLADVLKQAHANGAEELSFVTRAKMNRAEPTVKATSALWSPRTGIVDSHELMRSIVASARQGGCEFAWRHRLVGVSLTSEGYELGLETPSGALDKFNVRFVVNAAGLDADYVAALAGVDVEEAGYRQVFVKGNYFRLTRRNLVRHLIYPVPPAGLVGLGLHLTLDLAGNARIGPDVEALADRTRNYDVSEGRAAAFVEAASRYLSGVEARHLEPDQAGIRPKLRAGVGVVRDFVVAEESARGLPGWVNLIGIESPGLTASLAIAEHVSRLLEAALPNVHARC